MTGSFWFLCSSTAGFTRGDPPPPTHIFIYLLDAGFRLALLKRQHATSRSPSHPLTCANTGYAKLRYNHLNIKPWRICPPKTSFQPRRHGNVPGIAESTWRWDVLAWFSPSLCSFIEVQTIVCVLVISEIPTPWAFNTSAVSCLFGWYPFPAPPLALYQRVAEGNGVSGVTLCCTLDTSKLRTESALQFVPACRRCTLTSRVSHEPISTALSGTMARKAGASCVDVMGSDSFRNLTLMEKYVGVFWCCFQLCNMMLRTLTYLCGDWVKF